MTDEKEIANDGQAEFQVWWIPQIPGKPFEVPVSSYKDGLALEDVLGKYDAFQFENNIKGDYCNTGGTQWKHPVLTDDQWSDLEDYEAEEYGWTTAQ